jgi:uncharacterized membrane protein YjgN (DUF898 family)
MTTLETAPQAPGETLVFQQRSTRGDFLGLCLKNGLLNIITLTLYRFWGKTEVRRRVWRSTYLNDEPFEYTGRGVELFLGFLIAAFVVGLPFLLAVFAAQMMGPAAAGMILLPLYVFLFWLIGFGMFTAFRYMASRTVWRGVRFQLHGSAVSYGLAFMGYLLLSAVTLGWTWPEAQRNLAQKLWGGLSFGDRRLKFDPQACREVKVYGAFALAWVGTFVLYLIFIGVVVAVAIGMASDMQAPPSEPPLELMIGSYAAGLVMGVLILILFAKFQAALLRSIVAGIVFDGARFTIAVRGRALAWLTISNLLLIVVTLGFGVPYVQARTARFLINRLSSEGTADLAGIRQTETGPRTGEGLADAFGLAPI